MLERAANAQLTSFTRRGADGSGTWQRGSDIRRAEDAKQGVVTESRDVDRGIVLRRTWLRRTPNTERSEDGGKPASRTSLGGGIDDVKV